MLLVNTDYIEGKKFEMIVKLCISLAISHIPVAVRICIKACKWRTKNCIVDAVIWYIFDKFHTVSIVNCILFFDCLR